MAKPRKPSKHDSVRRRLREEGGWKLTSPETIPSRDREAVRKHVLRAVEDNAENIIPRRLGVSGSRWADSFMRCFDKSKAIDLLLGHKELDCRQISDVLHILVNSYVDATLPVLETPSEVYFLDSEPLDNDEIKRRINVLWEAASILEKAGDAWLAQRVRRARSPFVQAYKPPRTSRGAKPKRSLNLAMRLDVNLPDMTRDVRRRELIAVLITDFERRTTAEKIRTSLSKRYNQLL